MHKYFYVYTPNTKCALSEKIIVPFSMAIGNIELMHKCFPKHLHMGRARMKEDKETKEGKKRDVSMEISKVDTKQKEVPSAYLYIIKIQ